MGDRRKTETVSCLAALPYEGIVVVRVRERVSAVRQSNVAVGAAALLVTVALVMPLVPMLTLVNESWQGVSKL